MEESRESGKRRAYISTRKTSKIGKNEQRFNDRIYDNFMLSLSVACVVLLIAADLMLLLLVRDN